MLGNVQSYNGKYFEILTILGSIIIGNTPLDMTDKYAEGIEQEVMQC